MPFWEEIRAPQRLEDLATAFEAAGDRQGAPRSRSSSGDILVGAMEQMGALLGETVRIWTDSPGCSACS